MANTKNLYSFSSGQGLGYNNFQGPKRGSIGSGNLVDYGDGAESDASTMTSASGVGYYDGDPNQRSSRSRCPTVMSPEGIATRSSSVPGICDTSYTTYILYKYRN